MAKYGESNRYKLANYEKETIVNYNDEGKEATVYTCNAALVRKMDKLMEQHPEEVRLKRKDEVSKTYFVPKEWVKVSPPRKLNLSDERRQELSERAKQMKCSS